MGRNLEQLPQFTKALIKSHLLACGWSYTDLDKPIIAIANSWNEFNHGHMPQRQIADKVKEGILAAGGLPLEFNTIGPCDALGQGHEGMKYILPSRGIIADSVEIMLRSQAIADGLVMISSCDKITPAMLMACLRLDLPAVHICSGTCTPAISFAESKRIRKDFLDGKIDEREMVEGNARLYNGTGICPYMGTANTMDIFTEALGLSISGSSTIPANSDARMECAHKTGELAVSLSQSSRKPSEIVTANSIYNGLIVLAALSGSLNHLLHVPAVAKTIGVEIDFDTIAEINEKTPQLCTINPSGPHSIIDLHEAGGIPAVIKELLPLLHQECINVEGRRIDEIAASAMNLKPDVIRSIAEPVSTRGGIIILKGNIARQGAAMRLSTIPEGMDQFSGPAHVFDSEEAAMQAVNAGEIPEGAVVVVRNEGPRGGPGMREMHRLVGAFAGKRIAVITDGRFSGATGGLSIGYLCPEAALGGEIASVQNGDMISIDIRKRTIDLILTPDVIVERMSKINFAEPQKETRLLEKYARSVGPAFTGAVEP
jgi:dihydroxy-acid dehydratase